MTKHFTSIVTVGLLVTALISIGSAAMLLAIIIAIKEADKKINEKI